MSANPTGYTGVLEIKSPVGFLIWGLSLYIRPERIRIIKEFCWAD
jgi:hypothetical protein